METPHLELEHVRKAYGSVVAVDELSFSVPRGSIFGLIGPNGAGKTTTIRVIMRITHADRGVIKLGGEPVDDLLRERIGYLPEERGLYRRMRALDHLAYLAQVRGLRADEARRRAAAWLERLGLADQARRRVEELSKGMQQKVQFAGAVIHDPELVIFDEPFSGLDPIATRQLKDEIASMRTRGRTVVFSTHVMPQAEELCDHICLINRGRALLNGTLADVRARYAGPSLRIETRASVEEILAVAGVRSVRPNGETFTVELADSTPVPEGIRQLAAALPLGSVTPFRVSLEDVFLRAVGEDRAPLE